MGYEESSEGLGEARSAARVGAAMNDDMLAEGMVFAAEQVIEHLAQADEWDLAPRLYVIGHGPIQSEAEVPEWVRTAGGEPMEPDALGMQLMLIPVIVPDWMWAHAEEPYRALEALAALIRQAGPPPEIREQSDLRIMGSLFVSEAWMLQRTAEDVDGQAWADEHADKVHEHPQRIEVRIAYMVDSAGDHYSVVRARGDGESMITRPRGEGAAVTGRIPDALSAVTAALIDDVDGELASFTQGKGGSS